MRLIAGLLVYVMLLLLVAGLGLSLGMLELLGMLAISIAATVVLRRRSVELDE